MDSETSRKSQLFDQFPPVSTSEWETQIRKDLRSEDYSRKLIWNTPEGFPVRPFYRAEDLKGLEFLSIPPDVFPFPRGHKIRDNSWEVRQNIKSTDPGEANRLALEAIGQGVTAIGFDASKIRLLKEMRLLMHGIPLEQVSIHFLNQHSCRETLKLFLSLLRKSGQEPGDVRGSLAFDPIGNLPDTGIAGQLTEKDFGKAVELLNTCSRDIPAFRVITVHGNRFQDAGSTLVQELAFALAVGNEYMAELTARGLPVTEIAPRMTFSFALGPALFLEIAKLRAARLLWAVITEQYSPGDPRNCKMNMHCSTANWNKTLFDPFNNLLRTTTEGISGVLGGTDSLEILPFQVASRSQDPFGERLARNQQFIFREESYLGHVADAAGGSYLLENLTDSIASHAWDLFREVETRGGVVRCIREGFLQDSIRRSREARKQDAAARKFFILGTNQFPDLQETVSADITGLAAGKQPTLPGDTGIPPFRVAEPFERLRLATEQFVASGNPRPAVFLFPIGNLTMRLARTGFSANFFGCAGYRIVESAGITDIDAGIREALDSRATLVVICSSNEELPAIAPEITRKIKMEKPAVRVVVAGYPAEAIPELTRAGIDDFIHLQSNLLDTLCRTHRFLGIQI